MTAWDPTRYLQFADDRSRPFVDLVGRIEGDPRSIVDLGCGPGHLTAVLRSRWPEARIHGVDSSAQMIEKAVADNLDAHASYELADVATWTPPSLGVSLLDRGAADTAAASSIGVSLLDRGAADTAAASSADLIVSNALFQWVPDQLAVIERLSAAIAPGGTFALQVPINFGGPSHVLLHEISSRGPYASHTEGLHADRTIPPEAYLDLFSRLGWSVDVWQTTYLHVLHGDDPVFDWISGTGARPILQALPEGLREEFIDDYKAALRKAYPRESWGTAFPFARVFAVARRGD